MQDKEPYTKQQATVIYYTVLITSVLAVMFMTAGFYVNWQAKRQLQMNSACLEPLDNTVGDASQTITNKGETK